MHEPKKFVSGKKSDLFQIIEQLNQFTKTIIEAAVHQTSKLKTEWSVNRTQDLTIDKHF